MALSFIAENTELVFEPAYLVNAGYTGRNQLAVQEHVEELRKMGISTPEKTPCFFPKSAGMIQQDGAVAALDSDCSAEVEFVILVAKDGWYVSVGCDIFDVKVEGLKADKSKCLYPNYLAKEAWSYEAVKDHWDALILRSWIDGDRLYQEGPLASMMEPGVMMEKLAPYLEDGVKAGLVLSGGTLSCLIEGMPYTDSFRFELEDPVLNRKISGQIPFNKLSWFREV